MSDKKEVRSKYAERNFYEVFGVSKSSPLKEIQRSYRSLALKVHPDRNGNSLESTRDFQELSRMMEILNDPLRRASYDEMGDPESATDIIDPERWRTVFQKVTEADIKSFSDRYLLSQEEKEDVLFAYTKFQGNLTKMLEWIPLSDPSHLERYRAIILAGVTQGTIKSFPAWNLNNTNLLTKQHTAKYASEAKEAEELKKQLLEKYKPFQKDENKDEWDEDDDDDDEDDDEEEDEGSQGKNKKIVSRSRNELVARDRTNGALQSGGLAMSMRQREMARQQALIKDLEKRYGKKRKSSNPKLPSEEEFRQIQKRLDKAKSHKNNTTTYKRPKH